MPNEKTRIYLDELDNKYENKYNFYKELEEKTKEYTMNYRVEFVYDPRTNTTNIFIWKGFKIIDKRSMPENIDWRRRKKIREEIINDLKRQDKNEIR